MALLNKILGKDEREENLKKEIKSLELRKESVLSSINGEIEQFRSEQRALFFEAGKYAYETWCEGKKQAELTSYWQQAQSLDEKIAVQEARKKEMSDRYDEEIQLIAGNLNVAAGNNAPAAASASSGTASCPKCGTPIADGDLFCQGCGAKLQ